MCYTTGMYRDCMEIEKIRVTDDFIIAEMPSLPF